MKKILHITNDFLGSAVYKNLFKAYSSLDVNQKVYTAYNPKRVVSIVNKSLNIRNCSIYAQPILNFYCRINFKYKVKLISSDLNDNIDLTEVSLIHAHTWYSDGAVAYEIYKKHKIDYIITVRNTDINLFFKYFYHLRGYGFQILKNAKKIVFISPNYQTRLFSNSFFKNSKELNILLSKSFIIPNGVDDFWINNCLSNNKSIPNHNLFRLIYVGKFDKGKNVKRLIKAVCSVYAKGYSIELVLIGGKGDEEKEVLSLINKNKNCVSFLGKKNKEELLIEYQRADIFVMPSLFETFGLVYIEALLQGIPVLYTKNEGIDGYYTENIGEKVNPYDIVDIEEKIIKIIENYTSYKFNFQLIKKNHCWSNIAQKYLSNIYK